MTRTRQTVITACTLLLALCALTTAQGASDCNERRGPSDKNFCKNQCLTSEPFENDTCLRYDPCCDENEYTGMTHFSPRPQGSNAVRKLMGGGRTANITLSYSKTFGHEALGRWYAPLCDNTITFGPEGGADTDVRAVEFGLPADFQSTICLRPSISTTLIDLDAWFELDRWVSGMWAYVAIPFVHTNWHWDANEVIANGGNTGTLSSPVYRSIKEAWCGDKPFGDAPALHCAKACYGRKKENHCAGIRLDVGYDAWRSACGHVGVGVTTVAGIGTHGTSTNLFQPVIGTGRSWQLGVTMNASQVLWEAYDEYLLTIHLDATATHLFGHCQQRVLGLKDNGPWSHYLLLKKFDAQGNYVSLERAANILCQNLHIKADIMADIGVILTYHHCDTTFSLGGGFWGRSGEDLSGSCPTIAENTYGIKGDQPTGDRTTASTTTIKQAGPEDAAPVYLRNADLSTAHALHPRSIAGTFFASCERHWDEWCWHPYAGIGGSVEFPLGNTALKQWSIMLKGGVTL